MKKQTVGDILNKGRAWKRALGMLCLFPMLAVVVMLLTIFYNENPEVFVGLFATIIVVLLAMTGFYLISTNDKL